MPIFTFSEIFTHHIQNFFDIIAPIYDMLRPNARNVFDKLMRLVEFKSSDIVVDLGGGTGAIAKFFVDKVKQIQVIDPSQKMIERCRQHTGLSCLIGRGEKLPLADYSADKIILVDAFHHIPNQTKTIKEIKRVLKKDGVAIVAEYNPTAIGGKLIVLLEKLLCLGSVFHSPTELAKLFTNQNFVVQIIDNEKMNYFLLIKNP